MATETERKCHSNGNGGKCVKLFGVNIACNRNCNSYESVSSGNPKKRRRRDTETNGGVWSSLPGDLLRSIADKIDSIENYLSFSCVCRSWYSLAADFYEKLHFQTPFYMYGIDDDNPNPKLKFRNHALKRDSELYVPEAAGRRCFGSPFGWLVTFRPVDLQFSLVNPFTRATIPLPSLTTLPDLRLRPNFHYNPPTDFLKAFLVADPVESPRDCLVLIVFGPSEGGDSIGDSVLAFAKPGKDKDNAWCLIPGSEDLWDLWDIISFQGKLFGVKRCCTLELSVVLIEIRPTPRVIEFASQVIPTQDTEFGFPGWDLDIDCSWAPNQHPDNFFMRRKHLVDLNGQLCLVLRYFIGPSTAYFKIFTLNLFTRRFIRVWPSGNQCLFLGNNYSFTCKAVEASDIFTGNRVFYTYDDDWAMYVTPDAASGRREPDVGVWDMSHLDKVYFTRDPLTKYPPLWITPSIRFRRLKGF